MGRKQIRILFPNFVDVDNFNAQSLNAREIALRLNPQEFRATLFYQRQPDPRLIKHPSITLTHVPARLGAFKMLVHALMGCDIIFRANPDRFTYLFLHVPQALRRGTTIVDWLEGYDPRSPTEVSLQSSKYSKFIQPRVKHRIGITEYTARKHLEASGLDSQGIIPVGVDTRFFTPPSHRHNGTTVVLFIGALLPRKNPRAVLVAARRFRQTQFVVVGERRGSYHLRLRSTKDKWKLTNVTFLDPMPQSDLVKLMHRSDILFHPSRSEGLPKVVLEGAATGLPAVILDHYEAPAVLDKVTGFQVKTIHELLSKLELLIKDQSLRIRLGSAAVEYVRQFDWDVVVNRWEEVFQRIAVS